jgi:hypothetical protein
LRQFPAFLEATRDMSGLEIGGPSAVFQDRGIIPVYRELKALDNCTFATHTTWEGSLEEGRTFRFHVGKAPGMQFIRDGTDLKAIADDAYDLVLSSHNLEHIANPVKALREWRRVGRALILVLPDRRKTFDRTRPVTPVAHMLEDYKRGVGEDDMTHLDECLTMCDASLANPEDLVPERAEQARRNLEYRVLHHHVFDEKNGQELLEAAGYRVTAVEAAEPCHLAFLAIRDEAFQSEV